MRSSKARVAGCVLLVVTAVVISVFYSREKRLGRDRRPLKIVAVEDSTQKENAEPKKKSGVKLNSDSDHEISNGAASDSKERTEKGAPCFLIKYYHRALASHEDGEACLNHDNALAMNERDVDPRSVCVRVNGVPVKYQLVREESRAEVRIGPIAGPHAEVTLSYCTGKNHCDRGCEVLKDEFIEGLTAANEEEGDDSWGATADPGSQESAALEKEAKEFRGIASEFSQAGQHELFRDWIVFEERVQACKTKIVKN